MAICKPLPIVRCSLPLLLAISWMIAGTVSGEETREVKLGEITLKVPPSWKQQPPSNNLRLGQFEIPGPDKESGAAELSVFSFGGSDVDANLRRWIQSFQPDGRKAKAFQGNSPWGKYYLVDVQGTYNEPVGPPILRRTKPVPDSRMVSVMLLVKDKGAYFLKLVGPDATVAAATKDLRSSFGAEAEKETAYEAAE